LENRWQLNCQKLNTQLILSSRNKSELQKVQQACLRPKNVKILPLDLENYTSLKMKTEKATKLFGNLDIII